MKRIISCFLLLILAVALASPQAAAEAYVPHEIPSAPAMGGGALVSGSLASALGIDTTAAAPETSPAPTETVVPTASPEAPPAGSGETNAAPENTAAGLPAQSDTEKLPGSEFGIPVGMILFAVLVYILLLSSGM